jgi:RNA polymerase sigma-70 factor (ECF subfamily)
LVQQLFIPFVSKRMASNKHTLSKQAIEEEWEIVQAAQQNPARFGLLYDRYYEQIFRFIYKRTAEEELTADLCSQVFFKAMQNLKKYKFKGVPFSAWLYRIASNEINQFFRRNQKNRVVSLEDQYVHQLKDEFELEDKKELEFNLALLQDVIQLLKPAEVELLELRFFEQRPFKEIGEILDMTENNAKVKVYRLLQKMKKLFQKQL